MAKKIHTITLEDMTNFRPSVTMASSGGKHLIAQLDFESNEIIYTVEFRGETKTFSEFQFPLNAAVEAYNAIDERQVA